MQTEPKLTVKNIELTPNMEKLIKRGISKLEHVCNYIVSTSIILEQVQKRHQTGNVFKMQIDIKIPDRSDIIVERLSKNSKKTYLTTDEEPDLNSIPKPKKREEPLPSLVRRTFDSAQRELQKIVDKQRGEVKSHPQQQAQAMVEKLFPRMDYGFLRTMDGQQIYFHKNSVPHRHWQNLKVGTAVRYTPQIGEKGLQASTVEPVERPGSMEMHNQLHDELIVK